MLRRPVLWAAAALAFAPLAVNAQTTTSLSPTRLTIARSGSSTDLTISNGGTKPVRFSVHAFHWAQTASGDQQLSPTDDLIVYPQSFTIDPLDRRFIRVGFTGPLQPSEQSYRLVISELPPFDEKSTTGVGIAMLGRYSVPVFILPVNVQIHGEFQQVALQNARLTFALVASGTVHLQPSVVRVRALDARGATLFEEKIEAWYVLPGQPRIFSLAFPASACARVERVTFDATSNSGGAPIHASVSPAKTC